MPTYEYKTLVMSHGLFGMSKGEIKRVQLEAELSKLGADGWELVHVWFNQKMQAERDGHLMVFKRSI